MINIEIKEKEQNRLDEQYSAFVSFEYDSAIVNIIKSINFRFYNPNTTCWELPISQLETFINKLPEYDIQLSGNLEILNEDTTDLIPNGFEYKTKPYSHQEVALKYGLKYDKWFLGDEQGLGKTKQSLDIAIARKIKYGYKHCLIVCGVNTLKWNWLNEIHTHTNEDCFILGQKVDKKGKIKIGTTGNKLSDLKELFDNDNAPYFLITNVESFRDEGIANTVSELCRKKIINMCIADEMHKMKNPTSQQSKGFLKCLPECRIGMTGTPLMNNPLDLYVILKWLGYETHAFYSFKKHYCVMGGYGGYEIIGYQNMPELTSKMQSIMLRRLKKDVLDLPEKIYVSEYVDMTPKQAVVYKEVEASIKCNIDLIKADNNPLSKLIRLRQATGYTGILSSEIQESAKLDRLEDLVEETLSNGKQCLIFSNWTQMTDVIDRRMVKIQMSGTNASAGAYTALITGETPDNSRQDIVEAFQRGDLKVLVGTIGAMGTGLTLTAATTVIFVDEPWNKALFDQAVDRVHRIGTTENITIYSLMCKDTIDERIHDIIYKKGAMSDAIIDGKILNNKSMVIDYLLS